MNDFVAAVLLLVVGVVVGSIPPFFHDRIRWKREIASRNDDESRKALVELLRAARDVRHEARVLAKANEVGDKQGAEKAIETLSAARGRFQYSYQELSLLVDEDTYRILRSLDVASEHLEELALAGLSASDPDLVDAIEVTRSCRRNLRDHVRKANGRPDLGLPGRTTRPSKDLPAPDRLRARLDDGRP